MLATQYRSTELGKELLDRNASIDPPLSWPLLRGLIWWTRWHILALILPAILTRIIMLLVKFSLFGPTWYRRLGGKKPECAKLNSCINLPYIIDGIGCAELFQFGASKP